jgi:hypothetical protein
MVKRKTSFILVVSDFPFVLGMAAFRRIPFQMHAVLHDFHVTAAQHATSQHRLLCNRVGPTIPGIVTHLKQNTQTVLKLLERGLQRLLFVVRV